MGKYVRGMPEGAERHFDKYKVGGLPFQVFQLLEKPPNARRGLTRSVLSYGTPFCGRSKNEIAESQSKIDENQL